MKALLSHAPTWWHHCRGITNDNVDCGVDVWRTVTFPLLRQLTGTEDGFELKVRPVMMHALCMPWAAGEQHDACMR